MTEGGCALVLQKDLEYWTIGQLEHIISYPNARNTLVLVFIVGKSVFASGNLFFEAEFS